MIKLIFLCRRRSEVDRDEYAKRLLEDHVPLALKHHPTLRRYAIDIAEGDPQDGQDFDSLHSLSFDTLEDYLERLFDSPEGERIVRRKIGQFMASADAYATSERIHKDETPPAPRGERSPGVKWVYALQRHATLTHAAFVDHWLGVHVPLLLEQRPGITRYTTNAVEARLSETGEDWDGFAELQFAGPEEAWGNPFDPDPGDRAVGGSRDDFLARSLAWPVREYILM
jgi:hypothetical protein